ncbi:MAG: glycosyltransferase family 4 protein [Prolixibacteraceae bacterium]|nr:glycosyltransferase family 4 protein [Prolixibacteraceae bacterium]
MIIGFDAKRAFNNAAGLGNFSRNTISALADQFPDDRFFLFHPGNTNPLFTAPENSTEIKPKNLAWKILKNVWRSFQISKLAKEHHLDIYHGLSHELPAGIEKTGTKSVVTIHDLIYIRYPNFFMKIDRNIYDLKFRQACRVADRIHAISEQTKRDLIQFFEVPEEKIDVIYQSVNPMFFEVCTEEQKLAIRKKYKLPEAFILTVGTIEPRKNLMNLLKGMASEKIQIPLVVVGRSTGYQQRARSFIEENRLQVIFLHGIQDAELAVLYQSAKAMIYPSLFEGFGLPVAEAQASGCPVIASNTSSLPEAGGDAAIYINPEKPEEIGKAIVSLFADKNYRETIIAKGRINAQRFTPEKYAIQLSNLYKSIIHA